MSLAFYKPYTEDLMLAFTWGQCCGIVPGSQRGPFGDSSSHDTGGDPRGLRWDIRRAHLPSTMPHRSQSCGRHGCGCTELVVMV